jgi:CRISPR type III-A-associated RAMP protein Csm4
MSKYTRVRLLPLGPFHFGGRGVAMERADVGLPADSLFSALCVTLAQDEGEDEVTGLLARFGARAPFRLTSLLPYAGEVRFLPYPQITPSQTPKATAMQHRKRFKEIAWVSESVFRSLARGDEPAAALDEGLPITLHGGSIWVTRGEEVALRAFEAHDSETDEKQTGVLWRSAMRPRVTVDRTTSASAVWASGATHFNTAQAADGKRVVAGLYTVIEWLDADAALREQVKGWFERLGRAGIGGERSSGHGQFDARLDEMNDWNVGADGPFFATLAPYHPRWEERDALGEGASYDITIRRGWMSMPGFSNLRRGTVRMIADGSVLRWPGGKTGAALGDLIDVTPKAAADAGRRVWRYGLAFPVGIAAAAMRREGADDSA